MPREYRWEIQGPSRKEGTGRNGMNDIGSKDKDKSRKIKRNRIRRES